MLQNSDARPNGTSGSSAPRPGDDSIRARLRRVVADSSQSRVARCTGTPQASVSRYLKDRRIPADFCARLTEVLGVNPSWLLMGEGAPYLADVTAEVENTGSNLLKLVEAMNSVSRMQLGSLLGADHRRTLLDLGHRLETFEKLKAQIDEQASPVFDKLIDDFNSWMKKLEWEKAEALLPALEQVSRLCQDRHLQAYYEESIAYYLIEVGELDECAKARRRLFRRGLVEPVEPLESQLLNDANHLTTLFRAFRVTEAYRSARVLSILHEEQSDNDHYWLIQFAVGHLSVETGKLSEGTGLMVRAFNELPSQAANWYGSILLAQNLAGALTVKEAMATGLGRAEKADGVAKAGVARSLAPLVTWAEDLEQLAHFHDTLGDFLAELDRAGGRCLETHLRLLRQALEAPTESLLEQHDTDLQVRTFESSDGARSRFVVAIHRAQLARLVDSPRSAELLLESEKRRQELDADLTPWLAHRALHFRNALREPGCPPELAAEAREFFRTHVEAGYMAFMNAAGQA